ncbi:MAG: hypothetical protein ACUVTP_00525 [Candidatus Fervidibacter sp.]|uniref:hypothetical protein n=1 Tax=Candidatus Fervidibacter sp. TaxID=3100871 RepID=UPI00404B307A
MPYQGSRMPKPRQQTGNGNRKVGKAMAQETVSRHLSGQSLDLPTCPQCGAVMTLWRGAPFCPACGWREGCCD